MCLYVNAAVLGHWSWHRIGFVFHSSGVSFEHISYYIIHLFNIRVSFLKFFRRMPLPAGRAAALARVAHTSDLSKISEFLRTYATTDDMLL